MATRRGAPTKKRGRARGPRRRAPKRPLTIDEMLAIVSSAGLTRTGTPPRGRLEARFVVHLEHAPTMNEWGEMPHWKRKHLKDQCLTFMFAQNKGRRKQPIDGRPIVYMWRFSSVEPDGVPSWSKIPLDRLSGKHQGLNFLTDDKPSCVDDRYQWVKASPGKGFVYIEVWSDNQ